ncbi:unnamed protein product [Closterium sp. NIES-65]|nr:unnamed protein product [Closterium sp. NIES-65]
MAVGGMNLKWVRRRVTEALLVSGAIVACLVNHHVPEPYMVRDEIFHVPQTQQYCRGDLLTWHPLITTLPGLYYLALVFVGMQYALLQLLGIAKIAARLASTSDATSDATLSGATSAAGVSFASLCSPVALRRASRIRDLEPPPLVPHPNARLSLPSPPLPRSQLAAGLIIRQTNSVWALLALCLPHYAYPLPARSLPPSLCLSTSCSLSASLTMPIHFLLALCLPHYAYPLPARSLPPSLCLSTSCSLSASLTMPIHFLLALCLPHYAYPLPARSLPPSLCLSTSCSLSASLTMPIHFLLALCLPHYAYPLPARSLPPSLCLSTSCSLSASLTMPIHFLLALCLPHYAYPLPARSLPPSLCLSTSCSLSASLTMPIHFLLALCLPHYAYPLPARSLPPSLCLSTSCSLSASLTMPIHFLLALCLPHYAYPLPARSLPPSLCLSTSCSLSQLAAGSIIIRQTNAVWALLALCLSASQFLGMPTLLTPQETAQLEGFQAGGLDARAGSEAQRVAARKDTAEKDKAEKDKAEKDKAGKDKAEEDKTDKDSRGRSAEHGDLQNGVATDRIKGSFQDPSWATGAAARGEDAPRALLLLLHRAWALRGKFLGSFFPLLAVLAAFFVFVRVNGGIVVGARTEHRLSPHLTQPLYFAAFSALSLSPLLLAPSSLLPLLSTTSCSLRSAPGIIVAPSMSTSSPSLLFLSDRRPPSLFSTLVLSLLVPGLLFPTIKHFRYHVPLSFLRPRSSSFLPLPPLLLLSLFLLPPPPSSPPPLALPPSSPSLLSSSSRSLRSSPTLCLSLFLLVSALLFLTIENSRPPLSLADNHHGPFYIYCWLGSTLSIPLSLALSPTAPPPSLAHPYLLADNRHDPFYIYCCLIHPFRSALSSPTAPPPSLSHPYSLADNRHYPFYIWRRLINPSHAPFSSSLFLPKHHPSLSHPSQRFLLLPVYALSLLALTHALRRAMTPLGLFFFSAATAAVLVPSPLLEFRYFIPPFLLLLLHLPLPRNRLEKRVACALVVTAFAAVDIATMALFLFRPFKWEGHEGLQRFLW